MSNIQPTSTPYTPIIEGGAAVQRWAQPAFAPQPMFTSDDVQKRMLLTLLLAALIMGGLIRFALSLHSSAETITVTQPQTANGVGTSGDNNSGAAAASQALPTHSTLSPVFTPEIHYWANHIERWAAQHQIADANLVAIVMQIESCGFQDARSPAGATGLFQVMPFHFDVGENHYDPETNAYRGMLFLSQLLAQANDVGLAFAGYNGGPSVMVRNWDRWPNETQRYYRWATGIYQDIQNGETSSPTVQRWLDAGGRSLCQQAAARQQQSPATN
ncbi:MAG: transglycosylase SLT domain-containing protein [Anaerolineae bacterium]|nr:transglycosylase SLT domain-containing protein [Anaerolineae bacterium]